MVKNKDIGQSAKIVAAELKAELLKLESAYDQLDKDFAEFIDDDKKLYWNGAGASSFFKSCASYYDYNKKTVNELEKCNKYIQSLVK